jgi:glycosyltransferase involved in cell wall biosynthesis
MAFVVLPDFVPFFSVIICTYNRVDVLERAVNSLLAQTEHDWEAIVVDDGSHDNTMQYMRSICRQDKRFRMVYMHNRGQAMAKNVGILNATGLYITFLDSDDEYKPDHLMERKYLLCEHSMIDVLHGGVEVIGNPFVADMHNPSQMIHIQSCIIGGTMVVRRTLALAVEGFPAVRYGDDTMFFQRLQDYGATIARIDLPTYIYHRDTPDSLCTSMMATLSA